MNDALGTLVGRTISTPGEGVTVLTLSITSALTLQLPSLPTFERVVYMSGSENW